MINRFSGIYPINISSLIFKSFPIIPNTFLFFLLFYSLIKLIKELDYSVKKIEIFYKQIIKEILVIVWLPSFQFNLNFNEQDKIKDYLFMENSPDTIKKINLQTKLLIKFLQKYYKE